MSANLGGRRSGMAVAALVCGLVALVVPWGGFLLSVLAIIFGAVGINQTGKDPTLGGRGMAVGGLVCGIVSLIVWIPVIVLCGTLWFWAF